MKIRNRAAVIATALLIAACGGGDDSGEAAIKTQTAAAGEQGLSEFEMEHGLGPVTEPLNLGDIDPVLADQGRSIFEMKCESCHNLESRLVGPPLGEVTDRRSGEYVMNFIMNPGEMTKTHPVAKELLQEYLTPMPYQNVTLEEARSILEYLRDIQE